MEIGKLVGVKRQYLMNSDIFLAKGSSHFMCEDYVLKGDDYVIVSDGCSSSQYSDIAARLYSLYISQVLSTTDRAFPFSRIVDHVREMVIKTQYDIFYPRSFSLDATLLFAYNDGDFVKVHYFGDGFIIHKYKNQYPIITMIDYNNAPLYLSYYPLDSQRARDYASVYGTTYKLYTILNDEVIHITEIDWKKEFESGNIVTQMTLLKDDLEYVIISTDGLSSFIDHTGQHYSPLSQVIDFKGVAGSFLQRRMNKVLTNYAKQGIYHYDDLGMAVLSFV